MEEMRLTLDAFKKNVILAERLRAIVRYAQGANYIDKNTILLIADIEEDEVDA